MKTIGAMLLTGLLLSGCTNFGPYRSLVADASCDMPFHLDSRNDERISGAYNPKCAVQNHIVTARKTGDTENDVGYRLAFAEFDERTHTANRKQEEAILHLFDKDDETQRHYVIAFVHGWRHNADIGDSDVGQLRILLSYARSFLNQRCKSEHRRYCNYKLTGVFIGWRGRSFAEPRDSENPLWLAGVPPTFWGRKAESEALAEPVYQLLSAISGKLSLKPGDPAADKMLIVGHSFGGNMLATGMKNKMIDAIETHTSKTELAPPLGDLVFIVNPASEAHNWTDIQRRLRGVTGQNGRTQRPDWQAFFPLEQRPVYVSFTSACEWAEGELKNRTLKCDQATGRTFTIGQAAALKFGRETARTLGHVMPVLAHKDTRVSDVPEHPYPYGASHEFTTINSLEIPTEFTRGSELENSRCDIADGWLIEARKRVSGTGNRWDSSYCPSSNAPNNLIQISREKNIHVQFRHGLSPEGVSPGGYSGPGNEPSVVPANAPFWNVRSLDIAGHNGYVNYPQWCAINQLVLDKITEQTHNPQGSTCKGRQ